MHCVFYFLSYYIINSLKYSSIYLLKNRNYVLSSIASFFATFSFADIWDSYVYVLFFNARDKEKNLYVPRFIYLGM